MNFKTVFDLSTEKTDFLNGTLLIAYLFLIVGIGLTVIQMQKKKEVREKKPLAIALGFTIISLYTVWMVLLGSFLDRNKAKQIMQTGNYFMVEGKPENYHPMPREGHDNERFDIGGVHFEYSDYVMNGAGYNHAASLGGVITPENYYRLTYYMAFDINSNRIIKIEIRQ
jgi:hypothetical protein